jgi:preprotein translocase SecE subunit
MALTPYKPAQGLYARGATGVAVLVLVLFACLRMTQVIESDSAVRLLDIQVPWKMVWAGVIFLVCVAVTALFTFAFRTGIAGLDGKTQAYVDLLIDTQGELQKVSWPSREQLRRSTTTVLVCIIVLGAFLFAVDMVVNNLMRQLRVLPA